MKSYDKSLELFERAKRVTCGGSLTASKAPGRVGPIGGFPLYFDTDPANKDYAVSFTPAEFKVYVQNIRDAELALGDGVKRIQPAEEPMMRYRVQP